VSAPSTATVLAASSTACNPGRVSSAAFGGKLNGLQSRAGQQRSQPYGKAVLMARASSLPAVQGSRDLQQ